MKLEVNLLIQYFHEWNDSHFEGLLALPELRWNSRLRTAAGRFSPPRRPFAWRGDSAVIEIASYLLEKTEGQELVRDTLGHELIHYWLWARGKPYGHTREFLQKMKSMGVSRYNDHPKRNPIRYLYRCLHCSKAYPARKKLQNLACASCCKKYSRGRYHARFKLVFDSHLETCDPSHK